MKQQFIDDMKTHGFTEAQATTAFDTFVARVHTEVAIGDGYARVPGIGAFTRRLVPERVYVNPKDRTQIVAKPAHYSVKFKLSSTFKESMPTP